MCTICGKDFYSSKKNQKYCSNKCLSKSQEKRVSVNCNYCGKKIDIIQCNFKKNKYHFVNVVGLQKVGILMHII